MIESIIDENNFKDTQKSFKKKKKSEFSEISNQKEKNSKISLEIQYSSILNDCNKLITNHDYSNLLSQYQIGLNIAKELNDKYKINEILINIAINEFYLGKNKESLNLLEELYNEYINDLDNNVNNDLINLYLFCKLCSNLSLVYLSVNESDKSFEIIQNVINIINNQKNEKIKLYCLRFIIFILFRKKTLNDEDFDNININEINNNNNNKDNNNLTNSSINLFNSFLSYLKTGNVQLLLDTFQDYQDLLLSLQDYSGILFAIFNQNIENYILNKLTKTKKNNLKLNDTKVNFSALITRINLNRYLNLNESNLLKNNSISDNNKIIDKINELFNQKMIKAFDIYNLLYKEENKILTNLEENNNENNDEDDIENENIINTNKKNKAQKIFDKNKIFYIKFLFNAAINYIKNTLNDDDDNKNKILFQLQTTLNYINSNKIDLNLLNLNIFSQEFKNYLNFIINNLLKIYKKFLLTKFLNILKNKITKISKLSSKKKYYKINDFYQDAFITIYNGSIITKINFNSKGTKDHFYQIDEKNDVLEIFNKTGKEGEPPNKIIEFDQILKIKYGICSENLKSKYKSLANKNKWMYLSFILNNSSLDWCFKKEETLKNWFYGLQCFLRDNTQRKYKITSTTKFVLKRIKFKMISEINENSEKKMKSFIKVFLKYNKDFKI